EAVSVIDKKQCPPWPCPICRNGAIKLIPSSLSSKETNNSKSARHHEEWDPDWIEYIFTAWGECTSCKQSFAISGTGGIEFVMGEDGEIYETFFAPKMCNPMPDIFDIPEKCPPLVSKEIRAAFSLFWANRPACSGRLRVALEHLMD